MAMGGGETSFEEAMRNTETLKVTEVKQQYVNLLHKRVTAKMFDYNCDVKLSLGKETFRAHRHVLERESDYFAAMFSHDMKEKRQSSIELHDIGPSGFTAMMEYFYRGHITLDPGNTEEVIEAARFFHIEWLVHVSCDYLIHILSLENYDEVLMLVDKYSLGDLQDQIFSFISKNFVSLAKSSRFMKLSYDLLYGLMAEDHYIEATETFIFKMVLKWLDYDAEERGQYRESLLTLIRYHLVEIPFLDSVATEVSDMEDIKKRIEEAISYQSNPTAQCLQLYDDVRGAQGVLALYTGTVEAQLVHYKVPSLQGFFSEALDTSFMDSMFEFTGMAVLGNFLFVAGGYGRRNMCSSPSFYCYNPRNRLWAQLSSMRRPRVSFPLVGASEGLYAVMGIEHVVSEGIDQEIILNTVEYYDPLRNVWEILPELPVGSFSVGAAVSNGYLYVSGGITDDPEDNVPTNHLYMYSGKDLTWSTMPHMLVERHSHAMVACDNKLFIFGGYTSDPGTMLFRVCCQNEAFDLETNQWSAISDTPQSFGRIYPSAAMLNDTIYLLGGSDSKRFLHSYNQDKDVIEDGEACGEHIIKLVMLHVAFPLDIMDNLQGTEETF